MCPTPVLNAADVTWSTLKVAADAPIDRLAQLTAALAVSTEPGQLFCHIIAEGKTDRVLSTGNACLLFVKAEAAF